MKHSVAMNTQRSFMTGKKILFVCGILLFLTQGSWAQEKSDPVLMKISNEPISKSAFEKIYKKNNTTKENLADKKTLEEYLELFINYKLKVKEAESLKLDTSPSFKSELQNYRKQLAAPHLSDKEVTDKLMHEAYDRLKKDIHASHILVRVGPDALPKDTLVAYNKIIKIAERVKKGENFNQLAKEVSEDASAKENGGDLGYFTALLMVYPFENAAYNTQAGELSKVVRTKYGYHLLFVYEIRPAMGQYRVAHIMVKSPKNFTPEDTLKAKAKIDEIDQKLKGGEKFEDLVTQYSDDQSSSKKGGELPLFGTGRMVAEFERAAVALKKDGDISEPIRTPFGWHIIKRLEKKDLSSYEDMQSELKTKISRDSRSEMSRSVLISKIQKEYQFTEFPAARAEVFSGIDSTYLEGKWNAGKISNLDKPVFKILNRNYTQRELAKYLADHQSKRKGADLNSSLHTNYEQFVNESCISLKESRLELEIPEFKSLMDEYRDGILLFELTDQKVWTRAVKDTLGLQQFYAKNKSNYMWTERAEASIYTCANAEIAGNVKKLLQKGDLTDEQIQEEINKNSQLDLSITSGTYQKGENAFLDSVSWTKGITPSKNVNKSVVLARIKNILKAQPKLLEDAKGLVTADYQGFLEKEWIEQLRKKYPVSVNKDILSTIQ